MSDAYETPAEATERDAERLRELADECEAIASAGCELTMMFFLKKTARSMRAEASRMIGQAAAGDVDKDPPDE